VALFFVGIGLVVGDSSWQFSGNLSISAINNNGWTYRPIEFQAFDIAELWLGANYWSAEVTGTVLNGSVDLVTGSAYIGIGGYPFSFLAYFNANYDLAFGIGSGSSFAQLNVSASAGYIGTAYLFLEETDPNGKIVAVKSLKWVIPFIQSGLSWTRGAQDDSDATLNYVTYNATDDDSDVKVSFTFLVSSVAGILNGNIPVVPKSLETVVAISSYPYKNAANSLSLVMGIGYGGANLTTTRKTVYSQGSEVYFSLNDKVTVGGEVHQASISGYTYADVDTEVDNNNFKSQLQGRYSNEWSFNIVKVTFPPGADNIVYDPSMGNGNSAFDSSAPVVLSSSFVLVVLLAFVLVL